MPNQFDNNLLEQPPTQLLRENWPLLNEDQRLEHFSALEQEEAEEFLSTIDARDQAHLIFHMPPRERRAWMRSLAPDDAVDILQSVDHEERELLFNLLDNVKRREVTALLAFNEDEAGGLMSTRYARLRSDMTVDEAITYLRRQARRPVETISYAYVLDHEQHLLGVVSFRSLFLKPGSAMIKDIMTTEMITVSSDTKQEDVSRLLSQNNLLAIPVVDDTKKLMGIITIDDAMQAIEEEVTEDIQKIGGTEALEKPYLEIGFWSMVRKRGLWLSVLFIGELFTAGVMAHYEHEISRAIVLTLFIPLIISSGGNSGSQASTLVVRALALGEVRTSLWAKVLLRELFCGLVLGIILGVMGFLRIFLFPSSAKLYGAHFPLIAFTVASSLVGIVLWGTIAGSMLPLILKKLGLDPASASAPFVATIVDVTGLVIYFSIASLFLTGILL